MSCCHAAFASVLGPSAAAARARRSGPARGHAVSVRASHPQQPREGQAATPSASFGRRAAFASAAAAVFATSTSSLFAPAANADGLLTDYVTDSNDLVARQRALLREVGTRRGSILKQTTT